MFLATFHLLLVLGCLLMQPSTAPRLNAKFIKMWTNAKEQTKTVVAKRESAAAPPPPYIIHPSMRSLIEQERSRIPYVRLRNAELNAPGTLRARINPFKKYYPSGKLSTVCRGRSTIYNRPKVKAWLNIQVKSYWGGEGARYKRPIYFDLRNEMYIQGRSEECHTEDLIVVRKYLECALKRNMRMEYLIPRYPLHQIFYHHRTVHYNNY
ncbi:uncharacterized protein LOC108596452 [Drosophila busckii]|uniref:uncharacterized protein LOC108596452 n=1 Tax=Drosophila busckii TaxID=30019 RepID=UPI00083F0C42|nr:uncharacterized protein LOC108596452 [Drosophila busckii]